MKKLIAATLFAIPLLGFPFAYAEEANTQDVQVKDSWCTRIKVNQDEALQLQKVTVENSKFIWITVSKQPIEDNPAENSQEG